MKTPFSLVTSYFIVAMSVLAWPLSVQAEPDYEAETGPAPQIILRLHGSNTIGERLAPALVKEFLSTKLQGKRVQSISQGLNKVLIKAELPTGPVAIEIAAHGSTTAFQDLAAGTCDIGMASRQIKKSEKERLAFLGDMNSAKNEHILGLDGVAVFVHPDNPITSMPLQAIQDIFTGKVTEWEELSPEMHGHIEIHARDQKSGTFDTFKSLVLANTPLSAEAIRYESSSELSDTVSRQPLAIGFSGLPYVRKSKSIALADAMDTPISPSRHTVATEDYALSRRLYLYTASSSKNPYIASFIEFALSSQGQDEVAFIGFVDQNIKTFASTEKAANTTKALPQRPETITSLETITEKGKRLALNFRFLPGSSQLDGRAERDLARVSEFLADKPGQQIALIGFSDSTGDYDKNLALSASRASSIYERLRLLGIKNGCQIVGGGEEMPIADNNSEAGKEKNRRVEVWVIESQHITTVPTIKTNISDSI